MRSVQQPLAGLVLAAGLAAASATALQAESTIIVLDASGSMWAQIDGAHKITIARDVLNGVLNDLPADRSLGLLAYGHRQKGVCSDIELLVPPAPGSAGAVRDAAAALNPKGKTPLTDSVRQAAEALRFTEEKATVVLITDGLETCDADPCALGRTLAQTGVDFTAHVVGFGLKEGEGAQIACLAQETGGRYLDAANAAELSDALTQTVAAPPPPEPEAAVQSATVTAPAEIPAGAPFEANWEGPGNDGDYLVIVETGMPEGQTSGANYAYTRDGSPLTLRAPDALGRHEVRYILGKTRETIGRQEVTLTPIAATLESDFEVAAGAGFQVDWTGPSYQDDYITIVEAGAPEGDYGAYDYARNGSPTTLQAPDAVGDFEVRYVVGQSDRTLASHPLIVVGVSASLDAPAEAAAGSTLEVLWEGPDNKNDYITVVEAGAPEGSYTNYAYTRKGSPATLILPDALGAYELRYVVGQSDRTLAARPITLVGVTASLDAPNEIAAGASVSVAWEGPDNRNDYITIVEAGAPEGSHTNYTYTRKGSPTTLVVPDALGAYELRYVVGQSKRTLASKPVTLVPVGASLEAPAEIPAGATVEVAWEGPDNRNDYITIVEAGAPEGSHTNYTYTRKGSPAVLIVPDALGAYELRYVVGQSKRTLASKPVTLVGVSASLEAPAEASAGATIDVVWEGPDNRNDYITIVEAGAPEGSHTNYSYTRKGSPATITAPDALGAYELRYVVGQSKRTLASLPITLTPVSAELRLDNVPLPEGEAIVAWTGPNLRNDFIALAEPGAPAGTYLNYRYTRSGNPLTLKVPKVLGKLELRYVIGQSKRVLAVLPITVDIAQVSLEAPERVAAGGTLQIGWTGPGNWDDFVEILPAGSADTAEPTTATRTSQGSPLPIFAPAQPGAYEIRYKDRKTGEVAARRPLVVE
ncbi:MAG: VWA domain-containing protein [Pseudomonadota bacterium]